MSDENGSQTLEFQAEVTKLLDLMIHSLYSNKEIFLRELISNASDAADKLRFDGLRDDSLFENDPELHIRVEFNPEQRTLSVIDNGMGMSRGEIIDNLGTIAKSGTSQFLQSLTGDQVRDSRLIGQFGVGFYSAFIVAEKVEVTSRKAGAPRGEGVRWVSTGQADYTIETVDRPRRGTRVTLYLREGEDEFLDHGRLRAIIHRYSDHIPLPIRMDKAGKDEQGEETVNKATALWIRNKKDISDEEYVEFYRHVAHDFDEPLAHVHVKVEGKVEYASLLYIPTRAPFDLWDRDHRHGIKLYVRRVFIMDDAEQLLPSWLRFVRGIVDSDDLPLNVSRELLQHNRTIDTIRSGCTRKIVDLLGDLADKAPDKYARFWKEFGRVLKEGVIDLPDKREDLARLFRFCSTAVDGDEQGVSLQDYIGRMQEGQKAIYYITAENLQTARNSPHLEVFRARGIEVLLLTDPVDEWVTMHQSEYDGKPLRSVAKGALDLEPGAAETDAEKTAPEQPDGIVGRLNDALKDVVSAVRASRRLTSSPACLVGEEHELSRHLQKILEASGQKLPVPKPALEVNVTHPLVQRIGREQDAGRFSDWAHVLFDQALLSEGGQLHDPAGFVRRMNDLLLADADPAANK